MRRVASRPRETEHNVQSRQVYTEYRPDSTIMVLAGQMFARVAGSKAFAVKLIAVCFLTTLWRVGPRASRSGAEEGCEADTGASMNQSNQRAQEAPQ